MQAAKHLRDKNFFGRNCGKFFYAVLIQVFLFHVCTFRNNFVHKCGVCLGFLCENRCAAGFVCTEHRCRRTVKVVVKIGDAQFVERFSYQSIFVYLVFAVRRAEFVSQIGNFQNGKLVIVCKDDRLARFEFDLISSTITFFASIFADIFTSFKRCRLSIKKHLTPRGIRILLSNNVFPSTSTSGYPSNLSVLVFYGDLFFTVLLYHLRQRQSSFFTAFDENFSIFTLLLLLLRRGPSWKQAQRSSRIDLSPLRVSP